MTNSSSSSSGSATTIIAILDKILVNTLFIMLLIIIIHIILFIHIIISRLIFIFVIPIITLTEIARLVANSFKNVRSILHKFYFSECQIMQKSYRYTSICKTAMGN